MKWLFRIALVAFTLLVVALVGVGSFVSSQSHDAISAAQKNLLDGWKRWEADVKSDTAEWANHPLLQPRDGGDASRLIFAHVRWESGDGGAVEGTSDIPADLNEVFHDAGSEWAMRGVDAGTLDAIDVTWLSGLTQFAYWDIEPVGGHLDTFLYEPLSEPVPRFVELIPIARVRMLKGLNDGTHVQAAAEVRELARLCFTTENLIGEMVGTALLGVERRAHEVAVARNLDVTGWVPISEVAQQHLKRVLWAMKAPQSILATGELAATPVAIGPCSSLKEGIGIAHFLRGYADRAVPERYVAYTAALEASSCRLRRTRVAWSADSSAFHSPMQADVYCRANPDELICTPYVMKIPFVRTYVGSVLAAAGNPDWFKSYHSP